MLKEFAYKDKNRKVLVTSEDATMIEGVDFSYATTADEPAIQKFLEKYDVPKKLDEAEDEKLTDEEIQKKLEAERAEWAPYMKWFRRYLKVNVQPVKAS